MQTSINAHLRTVVFKPHYDMFRTQQNNYRVEFRFTKNANGNVNMNFAFNSSSSHLQRVVDFSKMDMTIQEFEKFMFKKDICGKTVASEFKKGTISILRVNGTLTIQWPKYPTDKSIFIHKLDEIIKDTIQMNPDGPRVFFTTTAIHIGSSDLETGHKSFPAVIKLSRCSQNYADEYPIVSGRPVNGTKGYHYRIEMDYIDPETGEYLLNSQTGAPSLCRFDYYGKSVDDLACLLYTYSNKKIIDFFTGLQNRTLVHTAEYAYNGKFIPHEMLSELRFPLDAAQEFDLMMRLE